jgi:FAD-linked sulfhydryl oxidase
LISRCRSCTSFASWAAANKSKSDSGESASPIANSAPELPQDCPADVETLGRSTWTFLHTLTATYPSTASKTHQTQTKQFLKLFGDMYPCAPCAADFRDWMAEEGNEPQVTKREDFGRWMCRAHNAVNVKLGKDEFDCDLWEKRWKTGEWGDGRCR